MAIFAGLNVKVNKTFHKIKTIATPITYIINQSLATVKFLNKLKMGKIGPIFKKDDEHNMNNHIPTGIQLLPSLSKVFVKAVHAQLFHYITNHLCVNQYGFRKGFSTEFALTK